MVSAPQWLWVVTAAAVTFAVAMLVILAVQSARNRRAEAAGVEMHVTPYIAKATVLSPAEQILFARLAQAVGQQALVCPKVRMADAVEVRGDALEWQAAWNRIAAKHIDFLLVAPDSSQPLLAIELDDPSGKYRLDDLLERALGAAGLPVLRLKPQRDYDPARLKQMIDERVYFGMTRSV